MKRLLSVTIVAIAVLSVTSCKNTEADDLALAQQCLDQVPEGNPDAATPCLAYVKDYDSQQALILRCSIIMTSGGFMEKKVIAAYNALKDKSQSNQAASFMAALSLDWTDVNDGLNKAKQADPYCQATGVPGLKYLSGVILAGTYMNQSIAAVTGAPVDVNDPNALNTAVNDYVTKCGAAVPDPTCPNDPGTLGNAAIGLSSSYCAGQDANQDVCNQIQGAVNAAGSDPTQVGQAVLCYMNHTTFNSGTGKCN